MKSVTILGFMAVAMLAGIVNGYALSVLWEWFIVPLFSADKLTIPTAMSLCLIMSLLTNQEAVDETELTWDIIEPKLTKAFLKPLIALAFGYLYLQFN